MIPESLKGSLEREAKSEKVSFGELVRRALGHYLLARKDPYSFDSFFSSKTVLEDKGPLDGAKRHDDTLYGRDVHGKQGKGR
ncbi:MAG: hypothetical protein Q7T11_01115 [Deltaproteobacteria bacterium]|nr:hypothetical protein [Deltaproteobacteria bacterium]